MLLTDIADFCIAVRSLYNSGTKAFEALIKNMDSDIHELYGKRNV